MTGFVQDAKRCDLAEILSVQKAAFSPIAAMLHKETLPPLLHTLTDIEADFEKQLIFKYSLDGRIVGSVRAYVDDQNVCHIDKLVVLPQYQSCGIGKALMQAVHERFSDCALFELFTSKNIAHIVDFYRKLGYAETHSQPVEGDCLVYLQRKNK